MRSFRRAWSGLLLLAAAAAWVTPAPADDVAEGKTAVAVETPAAEAATLSVRDVRVEPAGPGRRVVVALSRAPERLRTFSLDRPPRLVMDCSGPLGRTGGAEQRFPVDDPLVEGVRAARYQGRLRVVVDLRDGSLLQTARVEGAGLVADIGDVLAAVETAPAALASTAVPASAPAEFSAALVGESIAEPPSSLASFDPSRDLADAVTPADEPAAAAPAPKPAPVVVVKAPEPVSVVKADAREPEPPVVAEAPKPAPAPAAEAPEPAPEPAMVAEAPEPAPEPAMAAEAPKPAPAVVAETPKPAPAAASVVAEAPAPRAPAAREPEAPVAVAEAPRVPETPPAPIAKAAPAARTERPVLLANATTAPAAGRHAAAEARPPVVETRPSVARKVRGSGAPTPYAGQRISLDFKDADIQNVLRVLADVSDMNIIATDDVKGKVTLHLSEVPWDQALDLVLKTNRLEAMQEGNVVRISTVGRLEEERKQLRAAEDASVELEPLRITYQRVNYARADEAFIDKVKGVLTDRGSVTFDDRTNTIIIRDIQAGITDAEHLIRELDVQSPQVLIEANIVEATEDFGRGLGVQWGYRYNGGPQTGTPTGSNFPGSIGIGGSGLGAGAAPATGTGAGPSLVPFLADFPVPSGFGSGFGAGTGSALDLALGSLDGSSTLAARLTALEEEGKGKVISRPRVITMNNVAATIQSLTILRVKLPSTGTVINTGTGGAAGTASTATEKINTGITLVVTPQVSADGFVLMNIYAKSSQPDFARAVDGIPNEISREANSNVLIKNGETVVLGGIFRHTSDDRESGLPYLRSIPGLGWLFKRQLDTKRQEELLVFLTPKVVDPGNTALPDAGRLWNDRSKGG